MRNNEQARVVEYYFSPHSVVMVNSLRRTTWKYIFTDLLDKTQINKGTFKHPND